MNRSIGMLFIIVQLLIVVMVVYSDQYEEEFYLDNRESQELLDPHSFYYDRNSKMIKDEDLLLMKPTRNHGTQEELFYKRLVNLILTNLNIEMEDDELIIGMLSVQMSRSQMESLQNFEIGKTSLREIDTILSDVIKKPIYGYGSYLMNFVQLLLESLQTMFSIINEHREAAMVLFIMILIFIAIRKMKRRGLPIFLIVQVLLVASFFMTWWQLIQEAEIKSLVRQMQYSEIPITCQPDKMNLWQKVVSTFSFNNDCEKYYEAMLSNPKLRITPALVLSHFISTIILHPVSNIGHAISSFVANTTEGLPWMYSWVVKLLLFVCISIVIISLPFFIFGASFNIGLGPLFRIGIDSRKKERNRNAIEETEKREPIQIILQVAHGTDVQAITNKSEPQKPDILPAITNVDAEEQESEDEQDFSSGDTLESDKILASKHSKIESAEKCETSKPRKEIGSGDG